MPFMESIICVDAAIQAEVDVLEIVAPTKLKTRTGYGKPKITHFQAFVSLDDVDRVYCTPDGYSEGSGIPCPSINLYGNVHGFDMRAARLPVPVEIPENTSLPVYARSATAADTVVVSNMILEYPNGGAFMDIARGPGFTRRAFNNGSALASLVAEVSTAITDLAPNRKYQPATIGNGGVNGSTAGLVGPAFIRFDNSEISGSQLWLPIVNNGAYQVGNGPSYYSLAECGIKMPHFNGGQDFTMSCLGYTAEQPIAEIGFIVDKVLFP